MAYVKIYFSSRFARSYKKLPSKVKEIAAKKEKIFRKNPFDVRLKAHKLRGGLKKFWSFSIDDKYRIIFRFQDRETVLFYSVGDHSIYKFWD